MAKKVLLKDENSVEILPITRGELILDSSGKQALHSDEFLATTSQPGLMSKEDKNKIDNISISTLEISDLLTSGNKIATIKVGTTPYTIFAPESYDWSKIDNKPETIYNYGMVETLSNLNNANYWKFFQSTFQAENIAGSDLYNNWLSGITLGNDYITPYRVQFGLGYDGTAYSRYEKDHVWSSWKRLAFSNDKLSQFTDDVVAGKYLPLSGGKMDGSIIFKEGKSLKVTNNNKQELHVLYLDPSSQNFLIGYQTGITGKHGTNLYGNNILFKSQGSSTTSMFLNNSGNLTIGSSNLAGDSARLYVAGKSIFSGSVTINNPEVNTPFEAAVTLDAKSYGSASYSQIQWKNGSDDSARYGYINLKGSVYGHANGIDIGRINGEDNRLWVAITQDGITANSFIGNLDGTYVNKLTGYTKATTSSNITATDSLNIALGKLELKADTAYELVKGAYDGDGTIENLAEILKVLEGIKDTETIQAIVGKYLPLSGGTLTGPLTVNDTITASGYVKGHHFVPSGMINITNDDIDTTFRSTLLNVDGSTIPRCFITASRTGATARGSLLGNYASLIAWGSGDTHGFLQVPYISHAAHPIRIGGGNKDNISWVVDLVHSGNIKNQSVASAAKLTTSCTIWGQSFDGTENISGAISGATAIWGKKPEGGEYHNYRIIPYVNRLLFQIASYDGTSKNGVLELSGWESANLEKFAIFSSETTHNGTFTVGSLLTARGISTGAAITLTGTDSSTSTIAFSRTTYNYITSPAGGDIGLQPGGLTKNSATGYKFTVSEFRPGANNVYNLGLLEYRWKNVYATNFVGNTASLTSTITSSGFIKTESSNDYVLLGGGSHKAISDFVVKGDELTSNLTTITKTLTVSRDWVDTDIIIDSATFPDGDGSYAVQISRSSYYVFTGVITLLPSQAGRVSVEDSDEIILHGGGFDATFQYYLRTKHDTTNKVVKLQMARNNMDDRSLTFTFKFKKLI